MGCQNLNVKDTKPASKFQLDKTTDEQCPHILLRHIFKIKYITVFWWLLYKYERCIVVLRLCGIVVYWGLARSTILGGFVRAGVRVHDHL